MHRAGRKYYIYSTNFLFKKFNEISINFNSFIKFLLHSFGTIKDDGCVGGGRGGKDRLVSFVDSCETLPSGCWHRVTKDLELDKTNYKDLNKTKPNFPDGETDQIDASKANNCNGFHQ